MRTKAVVLVALLAGLGCKKSSNSPSARDFADELSSAYAARTVECTGATPDAARQRMLLFIRTEAIGEAQDAGRIDYDEGQRQACLDWVAAATCEQLSDVRVQTPCLAALVPQVEEGGNCTLFVDAGVTAECIDGECIADLSAACFAHGQCLKFAGEGALCHEGPYYRDCAPGFVCGPDYTCAAEPAIVVHTTAGDPCDTSYDSTDLCADALYCDGSSCQTRIADGLDCESDAQCAKGSRCDPMSGTCVARKEVGADCAPGSGECKVGAFCDTTTDQCTAYPSVGGACGSNGFEYRSCIDSWCELPLMGAAIVDPVEGTCQAYASEGEACDPQGVGGRPSVVEFGECGPGMSCDPESKTCMKWVCGMKE